MFWLFWQLVGVWIGCAAIYAALFVARRLGEWCYDNFEHPKTVAAVAIMLLIVFVST